MSVENLDIYEDIYVEKLEDLKDIYDLNDLDNACWMDISNMQLSDKFVEEYADKLHWDQVITRGFVSLETCMKYHHLFDRYAWEALQSLEDLPEEIIKNHWEKMDAYKLVCYQKVPPSVLYKMLKKKKIDIMEIIENQPLHTKLIEKFVDSDDPNYYIDWVYVSKHKTMSKKFIRTFKDHLSFFDLAKYQELSEDIIKEFAHLFDWDLISRYQKLSKEFIIEHSHLINAKELKQNKKVNQEELIKYGIYEMLELVK